VTAGNNVEVNGEVSSGDAKGQKDRNGTNSGDVKIKGETVYKKGVIKTGDAGDGANAVGDKAQKAGNGGNSGSATVEGSTETGSDSKVRNGEDGGKIKTGEPGQKGENNTGDPANDGDDGQSGEVDEKGDIIICDATPAADDPEWHGRALSFVARDSLTCSDLPESSMTADMHILMMVESGDLDLRGCEPNTFIAGEGISIILSGVIILDQGVSVYELMDPDPHITAVGELGEGHSEMARALATSRCSPNPFNARTVIKYRISRRAKVRIDIYNMLGEKVETLVDEEQLAGHHQVPWLAERVASGTYVCQIQAGEATVTRKMTLVK
jgi:hypothetical protein